MTSQHCFPGNGCFGKLMGRTGGHCLPTCFSLIHYGPRGIIPAHYHFFLCVISQLDQGNKRPDKGSQGPQQGTKGETDKKENYK